MALMDSGGGETYVGEMERHMARTAQILEGKVHRYVTENRVRLESFFFAYDRLRHRHITRAQFLRALNIALNNSLMLSREEELALFAKYSRDDGLINYRAFSDNCTMIQRDLEKTPLGDVFDHPVIDSHPRNPLSPKDEMHFHTKLLPKLQHIAREQGFVVKMNFMDFDFNRNGCVTRGQFLRAIPDKFQMACTAYEIGLLVDKYCQFDNYGRSSDISYHSLHIDVSGADPALTLPDGLKDRIDLGAQPARIRVLSDLERRVRHVARDRRLQMLPFFDDYDKLHSGFCPCMTFARVLCTLGLEKFSTELDSLMEIYQSDAHKDKWVDYKAFVAEIETPASSVRAVLQDLFDRLRREFAARGGVGLHGLLQALGRFDEMRDATVSYKDFQSVLPLCGISVSRAELDALFAHFGRSGRMQYFAFVCEIRGSLNRIRKRMLDAAFKNVVSSVGTVQMDVISQRFNPAAHPRVMDGTMGAEEALVDLEDGMDLMRSGEFRIEDLEDYYSFVGHDLSDKQFKYCVDNALH